MMSSTSKVQPLHSASEEVPDTQARGGGLRRIAGAEASNRDDESLPPVGGSIHVVSHPDGYRFAVRARLEVTLKALLDVVETANTFRATVELGLEFEVSEDQWRGASLGATTSSEGATRFLRQRRRPRKRVRARRERGRTSRARGRRRAAVDSATGELKRLFRLRRLKTVEFHQLLALQKYPFDYQVLAIRCEPRAPRSSGSTSRFVTRPHHCSRSTPSTRRRLDGVWGSHADAANVHPPLVNHAGTTSSSSHTRSPRRTVLAAISSRRTPTTSTI